MWSFLVGFPSSEFHLKLKLIKQDILPGQIIEADVVNFGYFGEWLGLLGIVEHDGVLGGDCEDHAIRKAEQSLKMSKKSEIAISSGIFDNPRETIKLSG